MAKVAKVEMERRAGSNTGSKSVTGTDHPHENSTPAASPTTINAERVALLAGLISDEKRVRMLGLIDGKRNVGALASELGCSQPALSHHMANCRMVGVIRFRREGKESFYELTEVGRRVMEAVGLLGGE